MIPPSFSPLTLPHRPWAVRLLGLAAALMFVVFVATPWLWCDPAPAPRSRTRAPDSDEQQRARALIEARDNCLVAALLARGVRVEAPWFQTVELRRALETDLIADAAHGELPTLREEARWLERLRRGAPRGERSWADVQLLTAAVHGYLLLAGSEAVPTAATHIDQPIERAKLRAFAGLDVTDLLGTWD